MNNSSSLSALCFAGSLNDTCIGSKASGSNDPPAQLSMEASY